MSLVETKLPREPDQLDLFYEDEEKETDEIPATAYTFNEAQRENSNRLHSLSIQLVKNSLINQNQSNDQGKIEDGLGKP